MATLEKLSVVAARLGVPWYWVPGRERYTQVGLPPASSDPSALARWPVSPTKGRSLSLSMFVSGKGPSGGRCIGYKRGSQFHAGIDLYAKFKDVIVACDSGTIVNFYYFYRGTYALIVDHGSFVINYGEVDGSSLLAVGLKSPTITASQSGDMRSGKNKRTYTPTSKSIPSWVARSLGSSGSKVTAGQAIALVGKMFRSSMLHFEMYSSGITANKQWNGFPLTAAPSGLIDPTNYLLKLTARERRVPQKEVRLPALHTS